MSAAIEEAIRMKRPGAKLVHLLPDINEELAHTAVGELSYEQFYNRVKGRTAPEPELVNAIRRLLGLSLNWPTPDPNIYPKFKQGYVRTNHELESLTYENPFISLAGTALYPIKVVGSASAGPGVTNVDINEELAFVPQRLADIGGVGWVIQGDSMSPMLESGDVAIFREHRDPRRKYVYLVRHEDEGDRVKWLDWQDGRWILVSLNKTHPVVPMDGHQLLGYLMGWYRIRGRRETLDSDPDGLRVDDVLPYFP